MSRIDLDKSVKDVIVILAEGNIGAVTVCAELIGISGEIDTDDVYHGYGSLLSLDKLKIYGPRIWMLYKDVCGEVLWKMIAVLRACQLDIISPLELDHAIDNYGAGLDLEDCIVKTLARLPGFKIPAPPEVPNNSDSLVD